MEHSIAICTDYNVNYIIGRILLRYKIEKGGLGGDARSGGGIDLLIGYVWVGFDHEYEFFPGVGLYEVSYGLEGWCD